MKQYIRKKIYGAWLSSDKGKGRGGAGYEQWSTRIVTKGGEEKGHYRSNQMEQDRDNISNFRGERTGEPGATRGSRTEAPSGTKGEKDRETRSNQREQNRGTNSG